MNGNMWNILSDLTTDLERLGEAFKANDAVMIPDDFKRELAEVLFKLFKTLGIPFPKRVDYSEPADYAEPEKTAKPPTKKATDRGEGRKDAPAGQGAKRSVKIKFVDKSARAEEAQKATPPAQPSHLTPAQVSADKYALMAQQFGDDFAARYYVPSAAKAGDDDWPKEQGWDWYVKPSKKELAQRAELTARRQALEQQEAAERAERIRIHNTYNSVFKGQ